MMTRTIDPDDIIQSEPDKSGSYDLLVDMNQAGLREDKVPPVEIRIDGKRFHRTGVVDAAGEKAAYWSYWNEGVPAINLQLSLC